MNIYIAREGVEIGECEESDLDQLARGGQVLPGDYYWREGMESWRLLSDLLPAETWAPPPPPVPPPKPAPPEPTATAPTLRLEIAEPAAEATTLPPPHLATEAAAAWKHFRTPKPVRLPPQYRLPLLGGGLLLALLLGIYLARSAGSGAAARDALFPPAQEKPLPSADEVKEKAAADLRARLERLPARPEPPLHTFYYGVAVNMRRSASARIPWSAIVRGGENVVDPATEKTTQHTDFILTVEYRDGTWTFKSYRASVSDIVKEVTTEIDEKEDTAAPPSLVGMMGLKMVEL